MNVNFNKKNTLKTFFVLFLISVLFIIKGGINKTFAQSEINLTISPPVGYLHVPPGTSNNHTIILENSGTTPITVTPTLVDFSTDGKSGRAIVSNQLTFPYVSLGQDDSVKEVTIPPQKKAQLTLYIDVPENAEEKEYPLTVLFFSKNELSKKQNAGESKINAAIGSNLIVLVSKQNKFNKILKITNINAPKIVDSFQKIQFSPLVENNSLGATTASGSAKIVNWRKETIAEFEIYPDTILGHNSRTIRALLSDENPEKPELGSFTYKPKFLLGPYQIVVTLTNESGTISQENFVFYAIPIAVIIAVIIAVATSIYFTKIKNKKNPI